MFRDIPPRGWARVISVVALAGIAIAGGAALGFVAMVVTGVVAEEVFPGVWGAGEWDAVLRASVGVAALTIVGALGSWAVADALSSLATAHELARHAERDPSTIAAWDRRRAATGTDPFGALAGFSVVFLAVGGIAILVLGLALSETSRYNPESAIEGLAVLGSVMGAVFAIILALALRATVWLPRWRRAVERIDAAWTGQRMADAAAEERRRRPAGEPFELSAVAAVLRKAAGLGTRVSSFVAAIAGISFLIGLYGRQQCRTCDPVRYDEPGEWVIDALMSIAGPGAVIAALFILASLALGWVARVLEFRALRRRAEAGRGTPGGELLTRVLTRGWPGTNAGLALVGTGWGLAPIIATAATVAPTTVPGWLPIAFAALGILGVVVLAWSEGAAARSRNRLRAAWWPGDVRPPTRKSGARPRGARTDASPPA